MAIVIEHEPCYIYHVRDFQEHSQILEAITLNYGAVAILARGSKRANSPLKALCQPFIPLKLSFRQGNNGGGLYYLSDYEFCEGGYSFKMPDMFCSMYINELLHHLYHSKEGDVRLFGTYIATLEAIANRDQIEIKLRAFELNLLKSLGYQISNYDEQGMPLQKQEYYRFCFGVGFIKIDPNYLEQQRAQFSLISAPKASTPAASPAASASAPASVSAAPAAPASFAATASAGRMEQRYGDDDSDSGLMFAKSKVRGRKLEDSSSAWGNSAYGNQAVPWWAQEQLSSSDSHRGHGSSYASAKQLAAYAADLMGPVLTGEQLLDILQQNFALPQAAANAKHLTGSIINRLLGGREIVSRRLYREYRQMRADKLQAKLQAKAQAQAQDQSEAKAVTETNADTKAETEAVAVPAKEQVAASSSTEAVLPETPEMSETSETVAAESEAKVEQSQEQEPLVAAAPEDSAVAADAATATLSTEAQASVERVAEYEEASEPSPATKAKAKAKASTRSRAKKAVADAAVTVVAAEAEEAPAKPKRSTRSKKAASDSVAAITDESVAKAKAKATAKVKTSTNMSTKPKTRAKTKSKDESLAESSST